MIERHRPPAEVGTPNMVSERCAIICGEAHDIRSNSSLAAEPCSPVIVKRGVVIRHNERCFSDLGQTERSPERRLPIWPDEWVRQHIVSERFRFLIQDCRDIQQHEGRSESAAVFVQRGCQDAAGLHDTAHLHNNLFGVGHHINRQSGYRRIERVIWIRQLPGIALLVACVLMRTMCPGVVEILLRHIESDRVRAQQPLRGSSPLCRNRRPEPDRPPLSQRTPEIAEQDGCSSGRMKCS